MRLVEHPAEDNTSGGGPSFDAEFAQDAGDVVLRCPRAHAHDARDFTVTFAFGDPVKGFTLSPR